jgi:hypothetical protein
MDDRAAELIERNRGVVARAATACERAREAIAAAEGAVRSAMQAMITAQTRQQVADRDGQVSPPDCPAAGHPRR